MGPTKVSFTNLLRGERGDGINKTLPSLPPSVGKAGAGEVRWHPDDRSPPSESNFPAKSCSWKIAVLDNGCFETNASLGFRITRFPYLSVSDIKHVQSSERQRQPPGLADVFPVPHQDRERLAQVHDPGLLPGQGHGCRQAHR